MKLNFSKNSGLIPVVIQDHQTGKVLMMAYMNEKALQKTKKEGKVTFYSRSRKKLWTKGETSGNFLLLKEILSDCDHDTLLLKVQPTGPVCHTGADTCFNEKNLNLFIYQLEKIIQDRKKNSPPNSYTAQLFKKGVKKMAQKVGEEATEVVIDAVSNQKEGLKEESADLIYHLLVLLSARNIPFREIEDILIKRHAGG